MWSKRGQQPLTPQVDVYGAGGTFANRFPVLISEMRPMFTSKDAAILL
jgi:hypothetical protein